MSGEKGEGYFQMSSHQTKEDNDQVLESQATSREEALSAEAQLTKQNNDSEELMDTLRKVMESAKIEGDHIDTLQACLKTSQEILTIAAKSLDLTCKNFTHNIPDNVPTFMRQNQSQSKEESPEDSERDSVVTDLNPSCKIFTDERHIPINKSQNQAQSIEESPKDTEGDRGDAEEKVCSLEETSLQTEQQFDQMAAMETGKEGSFSTLGDQKLAIEEIDKFMDKVWKEAEELLKLQAGIISTRQTLSSLIERVDKVRMELKDTEIKEQEPLSENQATPNNLEPRQDSEDGNVGNDMRPTYCDGDRVCPLCDQMFRISQSFDDFHFHVLTHFQGEDSNTDQSQGHK